MRSWQKNSSLGCMFEAEASTSRSTPKAAQRGAPFELPLPSIFATRLQVPPQLIAPTSNQQVYAARSAARSQPSAPQQHMHSLMLPEVQLGKNGPVPNEGPAPSKGGSPDNPTRDTVLLHPSTKSVWCVDDNGESRTYLAQVRLTSATTTEVFGAHNPHHSGFSGHREALNIFGRYVGAVLRTGLISSRPWEAAIPRQSARERGLNGPICSEPRGIELHGLSASTSCQIIARAYLPGRREDPIKSISEAELLELLTKRCKLGLRLS